VIVRSRDSDVPSEGQLRAILSVGFGLSNGIFVAAGYGGFQPNAGVYFAEKDHPNAASLSLVANCSYKASRPQISAPASSQELKFSPANVSHP
jgi:hypothetical protein